MTDLLPMQYLLIATGMPGGWVDERYLIVFCNAYLPADLRCMPTLQFREVAVQSYMRSFKRKMVIQSSANDREMVSCVVCLMLFLLPFPSTSSSLSSSPLSVIRFTKRT